MPEFKAAIFDLDGTLLDTLEDIADSINHVLLTHGWPDHPVDAYRYFVGDGLQTLVQRVLPSQKVGDATTVEMVVMEFRDEYANRWDAKTRPYPGIHELLNRLVMKGLQLAVLSNKPHRFTTLCISGFFDQWPWAAILGQQDGKSKKPDPQGAFEVAGNLGVRTDECLFFGDTPVDMETAKAAGMHAIGVLWGFRDADELRQAGADELIEKPGDFRLD